MSESKILTTLTPQQEYGIYISDCAFSQAKTINPTMLQNGINDLSLSHLKDLEQYDRVLVIGISEESEGEDDE